MAVKGKLTLKGLDAYLEQLARAGRDVDKAAGKALAAGADVAVEGMRARVPKDTRNLESHLGATAPRQDGNYVYVEVGLVGADAETARYGTAQEYGTSKMQAQPYIRPTIDEDGKQIRAAIKASLEEDGKL